MSILRGVLLVFALLGLAVQASAGPWPREAGKTFLSFGSLTSAPRDQITGNLRTFYTFYLERGLENALTLGVDAGSKDFLDYSAILFLRKPILDTDGPHRFAFQVGLGSKGDKAQRDALVQLGLSWGRGLETRFGSGWAVADFQAIYVVEGGGAATKLDLTYGIKPNDTLKLMMQVQAGRYPGSKAYVRLAPSFAWERKPGRHMVLGLQIGLSGDNRVGVKAGTWIDF